MTAKASSSTSRTYYLGHGRVDLQADLRDVNVLLYVCVGGGGITWATAGWTCRLISGMSMFCCVCGGGGITWATAEWTCRLISGMSMFCCVCVWGGGGRYYLGHGGMDLQADLGDVNVLLCVCVGGGGVLPGPRRNGPAG